MRTIESRDELLRLFEQRPHRTYTYRVPDGYLEDLPVDDERELRSLTDSEVQDVADFLEVDPADLAGPFEVVDASCPYCERRLGFLDFVQTAVSTQAHGRELLRDVLTGRGGTWLTIRGMDGGRPVICAECGQVGRLSTGYSEYRSRTYAYA